MKELKEMAKNFKTETKKQFNSCRDASMVVSDTGEIEIMACISKRNQAIDCIKMWALAFGKAPKSSFENNVYKLILKI